MTKITSVQNEKIKQVIKLKDKRYRDEEQKFLVEGYHLIEEAYKAQLLDMVFTTADNAPYQDVTTYQVGYEVIEKLSFTKTPQAIVGVVSMKPSAEYNKERYLLLDGIQDPGNLGTIIRSALGFGIEVILLGSDCVDLYNEKVVRATQGSLFHIGFIRGNIIEMIHQLKVLKIRLYAATLDQATEVDHIQVRTPYAICLGNEGSGIKQEVVELADERIYIKTSTQLESLNVGIAASIIMYEFDKKMKG